MIFNSNVFLVFLAVVSLLYWLRLLFISPSPRDYGALRMPSSARQHKD